MSQHVVRHRVGQTHTVRSKHVHGANFRAIDHHIPSGQCFYSKVQPRSRLD